MKQLITAFLLLLPVFCMAQNWEAVPQKNTPTQQTKPAKKKLSKAEKEALREEEDRPYLKGAVPMKDGEIVYAATIEAPGKSAQEIYDAAFSVMQQLTEGEEQLPSSKVALVNREEKKIVATYDEWLVFMSKILALDRAQFSYIIEAECTDGKLALSISRLRYIYYPERAEGFRSPAEEIISDELMIAPDGKHLNKRNAKFRRKTVDRMKQVTDLFRIALL